MTTRGTVATDGMIRRVPNQPKTPTHNLRVPDDLWNEARGYAVEDGTDLSTLIRKYLVRYVTAQRRKRKGKP